METVRGKFKCRSKAEVYWNKDARVIVFDAVCNDGTPENQRFHRYTPAGTVDITVDNPSAAEFFVLGQEYYLDFSKA
jgi:hypothetical protein